MGNSSPLNLESVLHLTVYLSHSTKQRTTDLVNSDAVGGLKEESWERGIGTWKSKQLIHFWEHSHVVLGNTLVYAKEDQSEHGPCNVADQRKVSSSSA